MPSLETLARDPRFQIIGVLTQTDKPVGRGHHLTSPPIKLTAERFGLPILQPVKLKELQTNDEFQKWIDPLPDVVVVVSYGKILPSWFLESAKHGAVNIHGSLLPRWRGASPIQAAITAGDVISGVTIMKLDELLDHGPIIAIQEEPIFPNDTGGTLHDRLALLGAKTLPDILAEYLNGNLAPKEQNHELATTCGRLTKDMGLLDPTRNSEENERLIRAYDPWPGVWTMVGDQQLKILESRIGELHINKSPGDRIIENRFPAIVCGDRCSLVLIKVKPEGKPAMDGSSYLNGHASQWLSR